MGDPFDKAETRRNLLMAGFIVAWVVGLVWALFASLSGGSDVAAVDDVPPGNSLTSSPAQHSTHGAAQTSPAQPRLQRCQEVYVAQRAVLHDAAVAVAQWQVHIGAMNKLVVGVLTLHQASQFWAQTRVRAHAHLVAFDRALRHLHRQAADCGSGAKDPTEAASRKLHRCRSAVAARKAVLQVARASLRTWAMHMKHMDMLRSGMISPAVAQALWIKKWHEGQQEVNQYRVAVHKARSYGNAC
jgi:hypothetical protein